MTVCFQSISGPISMSKTPFGLPFKVSSLISAAPVDIASYNIDFLPISFEPSGKDIICGRARENFHHDGNRYFRDLIQQHVGAYMVARTKVEKSEAIAIIVDKVNQSSPNGGFIKKDPTTGRWYRIKDSEARDKVGHAIRKAVQRLEETKPKLAGRLKKHNCASISYEASAASNRRSPSVFLDGSSVSFEQAPTATKAQPEEGIGESSDRSLSRRATIEPDASSNKVGVLEQPAAVEDSASRRSTRDQQEEAKIDSSRVFDRLFGINQTDGIMSAASHRTSGFVRPPGGLGSRPATSSSLSGLDTSIFPRGTSNPYTVDPTRLVAASLLGQPSPYQNFIPLTHAFTGQQYLGLNPGPAPANKLWLTAAAIRQQQEMQRAKEIDYARRLALTALHDISSQAPSPAGDLQSAGKGLTNNDGTKPTK